MACAACADSLDHCHGTLIVHRTDPTECTEEQCADLTVMRHPLILDCGDVPLGCRCADSAARPSRAS
ncbi:hypothetical protein FCG67_00460 [Rhodococcus oryzae]|uniref:Uncharacterized protein n=1 Tax=Rhodococcus oryzae TaxID=2571143 RepID=A0ABY2RSM7_9NOCA|nr:hypothetical protein FCG67_00460 [Rhodococcus oryzae]